MNQSINQSIKTAIRSIASKSQTLDDRAIMFVRSMRNVTPLCVVTSKQVSRVIWQKAASPIAAVSSPLGGGECTRLSCALGKQTVLNARGVRVQAVIWRYATNNRHVPRQTAPFRGDSVPPTWAHTSLSSQMACRSVFVHLTRVSIFNIQIRRPRYERHLLK